MVSVAWHATGVAKKGHWSYPMALHATLDCASTTNCCICTAHRKNEFVKTARRCVGNVQIHTGTIDGVWKLLIPEQLLSKTPKTSELNKTLWRYARCWQWRWEIQKVGAPLLEATGKLLAEMAQL